MNIAVIGATGDMGYGLAMRLAKAGHHICIGSRQAEKAQEAAGRMKAECGCGNITGLANPEACIANDFIILSVPSAGHRATLESLADLLQNKQVLDVTIPLAFKPLRYAPPAEGSNALETKAVLGGNAKVAAGFHTISAELLCDITQRVEGDLLVVGDDEETVAASIRLGEEIGLRAFNAGGLVHSPTVEAITPMLIGINRRYGKRHTGIALTGI